MIAERRGFLISGGTGTGKTTLLNALLGLCTPQERLILLEDTPELRRSMSRLLPSKPVPPTPKVPVKSGWVS